MSAFTKIKHSKGQTILTRVDNRSMVDSIEHTLTSSETPRPEFVQALQAFTVWVLRVCELPSNYDEQMTVIGVSISSGEYGGIVVTALKKVGEANAPVVINTPHVPEEPTSEAGNCLPRYIVDMLNELEEEANLFWKGERAQQDMFAAAKTDEPAVEPETGKDGVTATIRVNGGPAIDMDDTPAVEAALRPMIEGIFDRRDARVQQ